MSAEPAVLRAVEGADPQSGDGAKMRVIECIRIRCLGRLTVIPNLRVSCNSVAADRNPSRPAGEWSGFASAAAVT